MKKNNDAANQSWTTFWKSEPKGFDEVMKQATVFFSEQLEAVFPINSRDRVLDLGCGPGFLLEQIQARAEKVYGVDISEEYIRICSKLPYNNIELSAIQAYDNEAYAELIQRKGINKVIMLSVIQYYRSEQEVRDLITSMAEVGRQQPLSLLIADILPQRHSFIKDFSDLLGHALKKGYLFSLFRFMTHMVFSDYRKLNKKGVLKLDPGFFERMKQELNIKVEIRKDLTLHSQRFSVLLDFGK